MADLRASIDKREKRTFEEGFQLVIKEHTTFFRELLELCASNF